MTIYKIACTLAAIGDGSWEAVAVRYRPALESIYDRHGLTYLEPGSEHPHSPKTPGGKRSRKLSIVGFSASWAGRGDLFWQIDADYRYDQTLISSRIRSNSRQGKVHMTASMIRAAILFAVLPMGVSVDGQIARIAIVVTTAPPPPGSETYPGTEPPASLSAVDPSSTFYIEIWATNSAPPLSGLACVYVDVSFDPPVRAEAAAVIDSGLLPLNLVRTTIDNGIGLIDDAGGCQGIPPIENLGVNEWLLVDVIQMQATDARGPMTVTVADADNLFAGTAITGQAVNLAPRDIEFIGTSFNVGEGLPCLTTGDCADVDNDGIRDDNCIWWVCTDGQCNPTDIVFADVGGQFGNCSPDGTADGNDRFAILNCFANIDPNTPPPSTFPCEDAAPAAFNVDPGGSFGSCAPDGICDGNDAFAALNAFANATTCTCPLGGPAPVVSMDRKETVTTRLALRASDTLVAPGDYIDVDVMLTAPLDDLRGYQLHLSSSGGLSGHLRLIDVSVSADTPALRDDRARRRTKAAMPGKRDHVFAGHGYWDAYNIATSQLLVGLDERGLQTEPVAYLATFTYVATQQARGTFSIELLDDVSDPTQRTFLFPSTNRVMIAPAETEPVTIHVAAHK